MKKMLTLCLCILLMISGWTIPAMADEAPVKLSVLKGNDNSVFDPEQFPAQAQVMAAANVEVEVILADDITQAINLQMASGDLSDIIVAPKFSFLEYINTGYLLELTDLLESHGQNLLKNISQEGWDYVTFDGKRYGIPYENFNVKYPTTIRKDWLEKLGFEVKETYTLSELREILIAFGTMDPDGNGEADTYGMNAHGGGWKRTPMAIYGAFGGIPNQNYLNENGEFYCFNTSDDFRAALEYLHDLWVEGGIDPEFFVASGEQAKIKMANGKAGYATGWWSVVRDLVEAGFVENNPDGELMKIYITSDDGTKTGMQDNGLINNTTLITTACKNPEAAMNFLNYLASDEGYDLANWGLEGVDYVRDADGRINTIVRTDANQANVAIFSQIIRRLDVARFYDTTPLPEDATKGQQMQYPFQMIQYSPDETLYADIFYGLPATNESLEFATELDNYLTIKVVEFVTGETEINDETWAAFKAGYEAKGGTKVLESYAKLYNDMQGTNYTVAK